MISVQEALQILHENIPAPLTKNISLQGAYKCCLSKDIKAPESSPRYTNSAMDGYALRWEDCATANEHQPARLQIIGESQAGVPFDGEVSAGAAIRISTGAMLPTGADTVVRVEDTKEDGQYVDILAVRGLGQDVRHKGEEFQQGEVLFHKGDILGPRELALLAAVGLHEVPVYTPAKVSLLVTGTELARPDDAEIEPHQIRDSNTIMLESAVRESGAKISATSHVQDSLEKTIQAVKIAADSGDNIILCSGGVSVGRHDHVKDAALACGFEELFWKIRQKPGKPLFVCRKEDTLLFGLPGNPVSAFMCFSNYVRPVLAELQGLKSITDSVVAKAARKISNNGSRTNFLRVTVKEQPNDIAIIEEMSQQGSHMLSTIVHADGYISLEPGEVLEAGELIDVSLF